MWLYVAILYHPHHWWGCSFRVRKSRAHPWKCVILFPSLPPRSCRDQHLQTLPSLITACAFLILGEHGSKNDKHCWLENVSTNLYLFCVHEELSWGSKPFLLSKAPPVFVYFCYKYCSWHGAFLFHCCLLSVIVISGQGLCLHSSPTKKGRRKGQWLIWTCIWLMLNYFTTQSFSKQIYTFGF